MEPRSLINGTLSKLGKTNPYSLCTEMSVIPEQKDHLTLHSFFNRKGCIFHF